MRSTFIPLAKKSQGLKLHNAVATVSLSLPVRSRAGQEEEEDSHSMVSKLQCILSWLLLSLLCILFWKNLVISVSFHLHCWLSITFSPYSGFISHGQFFCWTSPGSPTDTFTFIHMTCTHLDLKCALSPCSPCPLVATAIHPHLQLYVPVSLPSETHHPSLFSSSTLHSVPYIC